MLERPRRRWIGRRGREVEGAIQSTAQDAVAELSREGGGEAAAEQFRLFGSVKEVIGRVVWGPF